MMKFTSCLLALALVAGVASGERAHLIVSKSVVEAPVVTDAPMTVKISIFNAGDSAAYDVKISDGSWPPEHFDLVKGPTKISFAKIEAGENETATFVVRPKVTGLYNNAPATGTYRPSEDSDETQDLVSSSMPMIAILSTSEKYISMILTLGGFVSLGFFSKTSEWKNFILLFVVLGVLLGGNQMALKMKRAKKLRDHQKAVEYFEAQEAKRR